MRTPTVGAFGKSNIGQAMFRRLHLPSLWHVITGIYDSIKIQHTYIYIYIHTYTFIHDACLYIICVYHAFCWYDPKCYVITQIWGYSTATKPMFFQLQGSSPRQGKATPWAGPMVCIVQRPDLAHGPSLIVEGINHKNQGFHQWILDSTDLNEACGVYSVINR